MVAQTEKIQQLQDQLAVVQFEQQANGIASIGRSVPSWIPALISTVVT